MTPTINTNLNLSTETLEFIEMKKQAAKRLKT